MEHYYQAHKSLDLEIRSIISEMETPVDAKTAGGKRGIVELRPDFDKVKDDIMFDALMYKFIQNPKLGDMLIATAPKILIKNTP